MKPVRLLLAAVVLAVLGGLIWWTSKHPSADSTKKDQTAQKVIPAAASSLDVTGLTIDKTGSEPLALVMNNGKWAITKPETAAADQDAAVALASAAQGLTWDRMIDEHPTNLSTYGLDKPSLQVTVALKNGKSTKVEWGSDTPTGSDTYLKIDGDPKVYTLQKVAESGVDKTFNDLRYKNLLTFDEDTMTGFSMTGKGGSGVIEFGKNAQGDWQVTKPKTFRADGSLVDDDVRKLKDARMDVTAPADTDQAATAKEFASAEKTGTATVTDPSGTQTLEIRKSKNGSYYAKSSAIPGIYKLAGGDLGDSFGKTAEDYRQKKLFDFGFVDPSRLDINGKGYLKSEDRWVTPGAGANAPQYDLASMTAVVDKLRDISATGFDDKANGKAAGTPVLYVAVTYGDKNKVEKVTFNRDAGNWQAVRENDPSVYILDPKTVDDLQKAIAGIKPYTAPKKK